MVGDCLLAAAFLSYMGPFLSNYRDEIVSQIWMKQVRGSEVTRAGVTWCSMRGMTSWREWGRGVEVMG